MDFTGGGAIGKFGYLGQFKLKPNIYGIHIEIELQIHFKFKVNFLIIFYGSPYLPLPPFQVWAVRPTNRYGGGA